jgi:hypothetical protein
MSDMAIYRQLRSWLSDEVERVARELATRLAIITKPGFPPFLSKRTSACKSSSRLDSYTAARSRSLSVERVSAGIGMLTITEVPGPFDSIFISPWNWRIRSRIPIIPTPEPRD